MQLSTLLLTFMASLAIAVPTNTGGGGGDGGGGGGGDDGGDNGGGGGTEYDPCKEVLIDAQPQCCAATVGDVADLTCATVSQVPTSADNFKDICAETGLTARCCTVSVVGVSLLCGKPVGL